MSVFEWDSVTSLRSGQVDKTDVGPLEVLGTNHQVLGSWEAFCDLPQRFQGVAFDEGIELQRQDKKNGPEVDGTPGVGTVEKQNLTNRYKSDGQQVLTRRLPEKESMDWEELIDGPLRSISFPDLIISMK
ncbi:hypothetical protein RUM44_012211 [Polyplax serrata]|uniref:Uncharacterized protein n=1 Tax=Polyplax serrata TaxID=468196 RepID=A0ABR1BAN4_POLSC